MSDVEFLAYIEKVEAGFKAGTALALDEHRRMGRSIVFWKNGKKIILTGDEIPAMTAEERAVFSK